jgi:hypothetical protein
LTPASLAIKRGFNLSFFVNSVSKICLFSAVRYREGYRSQPSYHRNRARNRADLSFGAPFDPL